MNRAIAFCGVFCTDCPAYRATQSNDPSLLHEALTHWRDEYHVPQLTLDDIICDGCQTDQRLNGYCRRCAIRPCAQAKNIPNCAYCSEYPCADLNHLLLVCEQQSEFFGFARNARVTLDNIRSGIEK